MVPGKGRESVEPEKEHDNNREGEFSGEIHTVRPITHIQNRRNFQETPEYILLEWEIIQVIVSLLGTEMYHPNDMYYKGNIVYISSTEIKKKYYEQTRKKLNKVYNKNELISLLSFRDGVVYDNICDIWSINSCNL